MKRCKVKVDPKWQMIRFDALPRRLRDLVNYHDDQVYIGMFGKLTVSGGQRVNSSGKAIRKGTPTART